MAHMAGRQLDASWTPNQRLNRQSCRRTVLHLAILRRLTQPASQKPVRTPQVPRDPRAEFSKRIKSPLPDQTGQSGQQARPGRMPSSPSRRSPCRSNELLAGKSISDTTSFASHWLLPQVHQVRASNRTPQAVCILFHPSLSVSWHEPAPVVQASIASFPSGPNRKRKIGCRGTTARYCRHSGPFAKSPP